MSVCSVDSFSGKSQKRNLCRASCVNTQPHVLASSRRNPHPTARKSRHRETQSLVDPVPRAADLWGGCERTNQQPPKGGQAPGTITDQRMTGFPAGGSRLEVKCPFFKPHCGPWSPAMRDRSGNQDASLALSVVLTSSLWLLPRPQPFPPIWCGLRASRQSWRPLPGSCLIIFPLNFLLNEFLSLFAALY